MQGKSDFRVHLYKGIPIFSISGYFSEELGKKLLQQGIEQMKKKIPGIVVDLEKCKIVTSPAVGFLLDLAMKIVDDFHGKMVFSGLNRIKESTFQMAGIVPIAMVAESIDSAVEFFQEK